MNIEEPVNEFVRVIPCLDVDGGRVVKGVNFKGLRDAGDPVELASFYDEQGADELVFLDITASSDKRETMVELAHRTSEELYIPFTIGGGVRSLEDARELLRGGADKVAVNTAAVERPELVAELSQEFGAQCVVAAIDAKRSKDGSYEVYTHGGRTPTGKDAVVWAIEAEKLGAGEILLTSMDRDGTKQGYDLSLTHLIAMGVNVPVIASGGAGKLEHLSEAVAKGKASAVLVASLFHPFPVQEDLGAGLSTQSLAGKAEYTIQEAKKHLADAGIGVRI